MEFSLAVFLLVLDAESVEFALMGKSLVLLVDNLPFLFECCNELLSLRVWHDLLLSVSFVFFVKLHLTDELILIINLTLDLLEVVWNFSISLLLKIVLRGVLRDFRSYSEIRQKRKDYQLRCFRQHWRRCNSYQIQVP